VSDKRRNTYRVLLDGEDAGNWSCDDLGEDDDANVFHKNGSCWCSGNMLDYGTKVTGKLREVLEADPPGYCSSCMRIELVLLRDDGSEVHYVDGGPSRVVLPGAA